jgi:mono/diheme cytochrome c family protein
MTLRPPRGLFAASALAAIFLAMQADAPAFAQSGDFARGRAFAEKTCARCHAIGRAGASRHKLAPPFRRIATKYRPADLQEAFAEGIMVGHRAPDMPEFALAPDEIDDLVAWLDRLRRRKN